MHYLRSSKFVALLLALCFVTLEPARAQDAPKTPSLDDYPPAIVSYILSEFAIQWRAIEQRGVPATLTELHSWNACDGTQENAHTLYLKAFETEKLSDRLRLLGEAADMPCYQYRFPEQSLWERLWNRTSPELDFLSDAREASRAIANEIVIQTALGDADQAVRHAEAGLGMLRHLAKAPESLVQLTRYACQGLILNAFQEMLSGLPLTEAQLLRLDHALAQAHDPAALARTWAGSRLIDESDEPFEGFQTIHVIDARSRAQLLAARSAVAIERYRMAHGAIPVSLDELVPAYLPEIPVDPFNGEPMRYAAGTDRYAVFSVDGDGEPCANPLEVARGEEQTMVRMPLEKIAKPLSEMPYSSPRSHGRSNTRAEKEAIKNIVTLASKTFSDHEGTIMMLSAGSLEGGIAVLAESIRPADSGATIPVMAAFWVRDGENFTVNNWAREIAPDLPKAPEIITFDRVRDAMH